MYRTGTIKNEWVIDGLTFFIYQLKIGNMNLSLHATYSVVAFNMNPLTGKLQLEFPYRNFIITMTDYHSTHYHN